MKDLKGHMALVTGGAGGIGLEFAKTLARQNCSLILLDISAERLKEAKKEIESIYSEKGSTTRKGEGATPEKLESGNQSLPQILELQTDLTSEDFIEKIETFCKEKKAEPDILINNAGIFSFKPIDETSQGKVEAFINLHVRAVTLLSQWFVQRRKERGSGWMLNMSSMSCWMPMPGLALYASTKSYIRVFTRSLHYEMKDYGVGVTVACPGGIATDLFGLPKKWQKFAVKIGVLQKPETFARKAVGKMLKNRKQYINGWLNRFLIFFVGILPTWVRMIVKHKMLDKGISR